MDKHENMDQLILLLARLNANPSCIILLLIKNSYNIQKSSKKTLILLKVLLADFFNLGKTATSIRRFHDCGFSFKPHSFKH